jgi:agmatine/peptidylarginine deiminase
LCLTTDAVLATNRVRFDEPTIREWLAAAYGGKQTLFLEPLAGEPTGHVDMFATFVAAGTVVLGAFDPTVDPENAVILDRNADRLSEMYVDGRRLRVVRVPMPPHDDGIWRTYTNVVYANGTLLVPIYNGQDTRGQHEALLTFSRLRPGWRVVGIDASEICKFGGALHCVTMNLGPVRHLPNFAPPRLRQSENRLAMPKQIGEWAILHF